MNRNNVNPREQKALKIVDKINDWISKIVSGLVYLCIPVFFILAVYHGIRAYRGINVGSRFSLSIAGLIVFATAGAILKLLYYIMEKLQQKEEEFNPLTMQMPEWGTITLETALHHMSYKTGVIIWDTVFVVLLVSLLGIMLFVGGNVPLILLICLLLATLLVAGHLFFSWRWKKRSFTKRLLRYTEKYFPIRDSQTYLLSLEESLRKSLLYYAKELVLTKDFIIGITELDTQFLPVAIPRAEITDMIFFCKRPVMSGHRPYDLGVLSCQMRSGKNVEFLVGQGPRMARVLKVLNHYQIAWRSADTIYE